MTASPCCSALRLARILPALVRGPLLLRPFLRLAAILRSEHMTVLISRNCEAPSLEGAGEAPSLGVPFYSFKKWEPHRLREQLISRFGQRGLVAALGLVRDRPRPLYILRR